VVEGEAESEGNGADGNDIAALSARRARVEEIEQFCRSLGPTELTFLAVRDELYGGSWEEVEHDLRARLQGKPYIFKLATKIEEDLGRIERLRGFERSRGVDLREVARSLGLDPTSMPS
jgi:hypothetical protein